MVARIVVNVAVVIVIIIIAAFLSLWSCEYEAMKMLLYSTAPNGQKVTVVISSAFEFS